MAETFSKKEKEKKKAKEKQDKAQKMKERKSNNNKGKALEDMLAYLDEDGNISSTPPDPNRKRKEIDLDNIQLGAAKNTEPENTLRNGIVTFFNDAKGYGFITDNQTKENVFVHFHQLSQPVKERDKVTFERERTPKGYSAINVKKVG